MSSAESEFLSSQLITCIGNKRSLLGPIAAAFTRVQQRLGRTHLAIADLFAGSGVVARLAKRFAARLVVNDLERYSELTQRCYLANRSELDLSALQQLHRDLLAALTEASLRPGIIAAHYAPANDQAIRPGERVFYTARNARYLDTARQLIAALPEPQQPLFLAPLLAEASVHANTAGVFKGFYKDAATGVGRFGGTNADALARIRGPITLPFPLFSEHECAVEVLRGDANEVARRLSGLDVAYLDPPYNQHPYGSNYFMLNLLADYQLPQRISTVSGIPLDWQRSAYNSRPRAAATLADLVEVLDARFILASFNSEGFIPRAQLEALLGRAGRVELVEIPYPTFRGSRNLRARAGRVTEYLFLVERN